MSTDTLIGRTLGEFEVLERIAVGGFGEVFRARQTTLGRDAIIKVLAGEVADVTRERFTREAQLASQLDHPFAAHIYAFGVETDGRQWIAMELVRGITLSELLAAQGSLPVARFVPLFEAICQVVQVAHEQGIVHRDLKPSNVMVVARAGVLLPKLLDLGIARLHATPPAPEADARADRELDRFDQGLHELLGERLAEIARTPEAASNLTGGALYLGSPPYMAPEQWVRPHAAGPPCDIYALGILAYECLSGKRPYDGPTTADIARAHLQPLPPLDPSLPPTLHAVLSKAVAKRANERYPTPLALARALESACRVEYQTLPRVPSDLLAAVFARAPQPLAETLAAADAATRDDEALARYKQTVELIAQYLGVLAFASWSRNGRPDPDGSIKWLIGLLCKGASPRLWGELATAVTKPFARIRDACPLPELVDLCHGAPKIGERILGVAASYEHAGVDKLAALVADVAELMSALADLFEYDLAIKTERGFERWTGTRRRPHPLIDTEVDAPEGAALLLDRNRAPVLALSLAKAISPTPSADRELFLVAGLGRYGARLIAQPSGFERQDPELAAELETIAGATTEAADREDGRAPYRGLSSFAVADNEFFYGRERESENLANHLRAHSFAAVVGPSGAGKSSFVQAGVVPLLPATWRTIVMRPGGSPFAALYAGLGFKPEITTANAIAKPAALFDRLSSEVRRRNEMLLIYVDQGEELVTLCHDDAERLAFAELLASVRDDDRVRVVLTLRDDFLMRMQRLFGERLTTGMQLLGTPQRADLRRILREPARRMGYEFEDDELVEEMVGSVVDNPSALALLSFTASRLWELRDRQFKKLRRRVYTSLGGVGGALAQHAEHVIVNMSADERELVREAFRHLVTADGTRSVLAKAELVELLGGGREHDAASRVIESLVGARLCVTAETATGVTVEISHEALLGSWPRLVTWRREDSDNARLRDRLRASARQWHADGRQRGMLWRGDVLVEYRLWRGRYHGRLGEVEEAFATACLRDEARGKRIRRSITGTAFAAVVAVAIALYVFGSRAQRSATQATTKTIELLEEQGRRDVLEFRPLHAAAPLARAYQLGGADGSLRFLLARSLASVDSQGPVLRGHDGFVRLAVFSDDGTRVVTAGDDDTLRLWDAATGAELAKVVVHGAKRLVRASADGTLVVAATSTGVELWRSRDLGVAEHRRLSPTTPTTLAVDASGDLVVVGDAAGRVHVLARGAEPRSSSPHGKPVVAAAVAGNGSAWATLDEGGTIAIARGDQIRTGTHHSTSLAIDFGGTRVASGGVDGDLRLWDVATGEYVTLIGHTKTVRALAFSPDGERLASTGEDGTTRLWTIADRRSIVLSGHQGTIFSVAFARDGRTLVTAGADGTVRIWDATSGATLDALDAHTAEAWSAQLDRDGVRVATAGFDATARIWRLPRRDERLPIALPELDVAVYDGDWIATAGKDGIARIHAATGTLLYQIQTGAETRAIAVSGDHAQLVTGTTTGTTVLWRLASPPQPTPLEATPGGVYAAAFSPAGDQLATCGEDAAIRIFDRKTGAAIRTLAGHTAPVWGLSYSRDGALLATGSDDGTVRVWDAATGTLVRHFGPFGAPINSVAFDPPSARIAFAGEDGWLRVFALDTGAPLGEVAAAHDIIGRVAFSPDGERIATGGFDPTVTVWDAATLRPLARLHRHVDVILGLGFDRDRLFTASADGALWLADVAIEHRPPVEVTRVLER